MHMLRFVPCSLEMTLITLGTRQRTCHIPCHVLRRQCLSSPYAQVHLMHFAKRFSGDDFKSLYPSNTTLPIRHTLCRPRDGPSTLIPRRPFNVRRKELNAVTPVVDDLNYVQYGSTHPERFAPRCSLTMLSFDERRAMLHIGWYHAYYRAPLMHWREGKEHALHHHSSRMTLNICDMHQSTKSDSPQGCHRCPSSFDAGCTTLDMG